MKTRDKILIPILFFAGVFYFTYGLCYVYNGDTGVGLAYLGIGLALLLVDYMTVRSAVTDDKLDKIIEKLPMKKS